MFTHDYMISILVDDTLRARRREADEARLARSLPRGRGGSVQKVSRPRRWSAARRLRTS